MYSVLINTSTCTLNKNNISILCSFEGDFWRPLTLQGTYLKWHLQAQFSSKIRNDTNKPNSLPEVLGRPFYR